MKAIIAISDEIIRGAYSDNFEKMDIEALKTGSGRELLKMIEKENPDIVIADVSLPDMGGFEILENVQNIPVIIFSTVERAAEKEKAINLNAKDYITPERYTPLDAAVRVKIALEGQMSYRVFLEPGIETEKLIKELGGEGSLCKKCGSKVALYLIKDIDKGRNYFKISTVCLNCLKK